MRDDEEKAETADYYCISCPFDWGVYKVFLYY